MIKRVISLYFRTTELITNYITPLLLFYIRFWMAQIFWYSGLTKINSWYSTLYLFREEYKIPFFPPEMAACLATAAELTCPILLFSGIFTRLTTIPLLIMTAIIQFFYLDLIDHAYWALLLTVILVARPGKISIDYFLVKKNFFKVK